MREIPLLLFAYNRPELTARVLAALAGQTVRPTSVTAYSDGPARAEDEGGVRAVRNLLREFRALPMTVIERPANLGSAGNIVSGLDEALARHAEVVVVEDDVLPSRVFCEAMQQLLDTYRAQRRVFSVGGYPILHPGALRGYPYDVVLSPRFSCWGWATWADRWQTMGPEIPTYASPYRTPQEVPRHAGDDLVQAVRMVSKYPGRYWDYPIMLKSLEQGWLHALSRRYLAVNIGAEGGVNYRPNPRLQRFLARSNPLSDQVPLRYPEVRDQPEVARAVRTYLADRERAAQPNWVDRLYGRVRALWPATPGADRGVSRS